MPEGPEVRIIAEQLNAQLKDCFVTEIETIGGRYLKSPIPGLTDWKPHRIEAVCSKGKLIVFRFSDGWYMFSSLGMTGSWGSTREKHSAVRLKVGRYLDG